MLFESTISEGGQVQTYTLDRAAAGTGYSVGKKKSKEVPLQAWSGPEGSRNLRFPHYVTTAQDVCKVVSLKHRPSLPQEMLLVLISVRG